MATNESLSAQNAYFNGKQDELDPFEGASFLSSILGLGRKSPAQQMRDQIKELKAFGWDAGDDNAYTYDDWLNYKNLKDSYAGGAADRQSLTALGDMIDDWSDRTFGNMAAETDNSMNILKDFYKNPETRGMIMDEDGMFDQGKSDNLIKTISNYLQENNGDYNYNAISNEDKQFIKDQLANGGIEMQTATGRTPNREKSGSLLGLVDFNGLDYNPRKDNYDDSLGLNTAKSIADVLSLLIPASGAARTAKVFKAASKADKSIPELKAAIKELPELNPRPAGFGEEDIKAALTNAKYDLAKAQDVADSSKLYNVFQRILGRDKDTPKRVFGRYNKAEQGLGKNVKNFENSLEDTAEEVTENAGKAKKKVNKLGLGAAGAAGIGTGAYYLGRDK